MGLPVLLTLVLVFTHLHRRGDTITAAITIDLLLTAATGVELQSECNLCSIIRAGSKPLKIIFMVMNEKENREHRE